MIVGRPKNEKGMHVEFVSYTGQYPNLCGGVLTLRIDGEEVRFGHDMKDFSFTNGYTDGNYDRFWQSGGSCGMDGKVYRLTSGRDWIIHYDQIPEKFRVYADEIDSEFNRNVQGGCCGGCR